MSYQAEPAPNQAFCGWDRRFTACVIDVLPIVIVLVILTVVFGDNGTSGSSVSLSLSGLPAVFLFLVAIGWFVHNWLVRQGSTGQTIGKGVAGIGVFKNNTTAPLGAGLAFARQLVHVVDAIPCFLGYLWPIWDKENRTFADVIMDSRVYRV